MKTGSVTLTESTYRALLYVYPRNFRVAYAKDAVEVFRDLHREAARDGGLRALFVLWSRTVVQTLIGGVAERWTSVVGSLFPDRDPRDRSPQRRLTHYLTDVLVSDVRFAARVLWKRPGFSLTSIMIMGLGIGATTAIFSVVDGVLLRDLPYPDPDRLVYFDEGSHTVPDFEDWQERLTSFDQLVAVRPQNMDLTNEGKPAQVAVARVTPQFFSLFGAAPQVGRLLTSEDASGPPKVAVISYSLWMSRWGPDSTVIGRVLRLDDISVEVVGVLRSGFSVPRRMASLQTGIWLPLDVTMAEYQTRSTYVLRVVGKLGRDASIQTATVQMDAWELWAQQEFPEQYKSSSGWVRDIPLIPLHEAVVGRISKTLFMLLGAVGFILLIACANVANLFLARGMDREREIALRVAIGAGRSRIVFQLLTEAVVLSLIGGVVGIGIAWVGIKVFVLLNAGGIPRMQEVGVDYRLLAFAAAVSVFTGVLFGTAPALYAVKTDVQSGLKETTNRASAGLRHLRLKNFLVVAEIALALVLLIGAGLLFNSFINLNKVDPGFVSENVITMPLSLGPSYDGPGDKRVRFARDIVERVNAIPGVTLASAGVTVPFGMGGRCCWMTRIRPQSDPEGDSLRIVAHPIAPGYFDVLRSRMIYGREFKWNDRADEDESVTIITRTTADRFFPNANPLGQVILFGRSRVRLTVVGVVEDLKYWSLSTDHDVNIFVPYALLGNGIPLFNVMVRAPQDVSGIPDLMRQAVWNLDPNMPVTEIVTMERRVRGSITEERFLTALLVTFAAIAILLAAGGIYGTILFSVSQRHREFGIRIALGASASQLLRQVVRHGASLTGAGIAVGLGVAYGLSRVLESQVYGLTTTDLRTFVSVSILLSAVALGASFIPARKAARTDPMDTLRTE